MTETVHVKNKRIGFKTISDTELVRRFRLGDEKAFSSIVLKYQHRLIRVARAILGDENEAMDISQDTFVKAYFSLKEFREESSLYTWLYRICYNLCISKLRRKKIINFLSFSDTENTKEYISTLPGPDEDYKRKEFRYAVSEALNTLPPRQRAVFIMKQVDGMKHGEIAKVMNITEGAVKASYFHAVNKLKSLLSSYGDDHEMR